MSDDGHLRAGDWVEVRSKEEILGTLDKRGELGALPFMPEMFQYCGQRFQVFKRAHKTCDPPNGLAARRMASGVHLASVRCDGMAHGGCQAGCLIFWKEAWLKRVAGKDQNPPASANSLPDAAIREARCSEEDVLAAVHQPGASIQLEDPAYVCQSTRLQAATTPLRWWDLRQYMEDVASGNVGVSRLVAGAIFTVYHRVTEAGVGLGAAMRWSYDMVQRIRGGPLYPLRRGKILKGTRTPARKLNLRPGELVKVRSYAEILETLDQAWTNRGLYFDPELVPFCNGTYRVLHRVERIIDEKTGKLVRLKSDAIILDGVACQARYSKCRRFCSRSIYPYWREIWLERVK